VVVNRLYYDADSVSTSIRISDTLLRRALADIYRAHGYRPDEIDPTLFAELCRTFDDAVTSGCADTPDLDADFIDALRHSDQVFAAFKVHRAQSDMARLLVDSNGALKPFEQWQKEVLPIASHQFGDWLRTEYDTAVLRAHQAADWQQFERERDVFPNLKWMPSTSLNPGLDHQVFWGTIRPIDDPFWSDHRPGDRWNCKCSLTSTDEPPTATPAAPSADPHNDAQQGLDENPGKSKALFSDDHPYYPASCADCAFHQAAPANFLRRFLAARRVKDCNNCRYINRAIERVKDPKKRVQAMFEEMKADDRYKQVLFDKRSGGVLAIHKSHNTDTGDREYFGGTMSGSDLERECAMQLFHSGHKVILCDEKKRKNNSVIYPALDMQLDGVMMDIKAMATPTDSYRATFFKKEQQIIKYNKREDVSTTADTLCIYFHDPSMFDEKVLKRSINKYKYQYNNEGKQLPRPIHKVIVVLYGEKQIREYPI
jgi:hypothetical protein